MAIIQSVIKNEEKVGIRFTIKIPFWRKKKLKNVRNDEKWEVIFIVITIDLPPKQTIKFYKKKKVISYVVILSGK